MEITACPEWGMSILIPSMHLGGWTLSVLSNASSKGPLTSVNIAVSLHIWQLTKCLSTLRAGVFLVSFINPHVLMQLNLFSKLFLHKTLKGIFALSKSQNSDVLSGSLKNWTSYQKPFNSLQRGVLSSWLLNGRNMLALLLVHHLDQSSLNGSLFQLWSRCPFTRTTGLSEHLDCWKAASPAVSATRVSHEFTQQHLHAR